MRRVDQFFKFIGLRPTVAIQFVLAVALIVYGVFVLSPFYDSTSAGLQAFFDLYAMRTVSALVYAIPGLITLVGMLFKFRQVAQAGTFMMFMGFLYYVFLRFLTGTIVPWTWLFPLALALVSAILYLSDKWLQ